MTTFTFVTVYWVKDPTHPKEGWMNQEVRSMREHRPSIGLPQIPYIARPAYAQLIYQKKGDGKVFWEIKNINSFSSHESERDIMKIELLIFGNY